MEIESIKNKKNSPSTMYKPGPNSTNFGGCCFLLAHIAELKRKSIPLKSIKYEANINGGLASVKLTQNYHNEDEKALDISYYFPTSDTMIFSGLQATFRSKTVTGRIKPKKAAKREFNSAKKQGDVVAFAEQHEEMQDIMKIELGNFPPKETLQISFSFITKLDISNQSCWNFIIPSTLTPRYTPKTKIISCIKIGDKRKIRNVLTPTKIRRNEFARNFVTVNKIYTWEVDVRVSWPGGANSIKCTSHPGEIEILEEKNCQRIFFKKGNKQFPNKDFVLEIFDKEIFKNKIIVAKFPNSDPKLPNSRPQFAALLQFVPEIYPGVKDLDQEAEQVQDFNFEYTFCEYFFVLDRSYSMRGSRIKKARDSLLIFLKSLPVNSKFNIISFGDDYETVFTTSQDYTDENIKIAIKEVEMMTANMCGTEILSPLVYCFNKPKIKNYQRNIFLLTDGAVSNTMDVLGLIRKKCRYKKARVFSIGIGNGCSSLLIRKSAELGKGKFAFISGEENMEAKVVSLLEDSISPSLTDFEVEYNKDHFAALCNVPGPNSHITRNEPFMMYVLLSKQVMKTSEKSTVIKIGFLDPIKGQRETREFKIDLRKEIIKDASFHKIVVKDIIDRGKLSYSDVKLGAKFSKDKKLKMNLSIDYQILSPVHTAFICLIHKNENGTSKAVEEIEVPNLLSNDYGEGFNYNSTYLFKPDASSNSKEKLRSDGRMYKTAGKSIKGNSKGKLLESRSGSRDRIKKHEKDKDDEIIQEDNTKDESLVTKVIKAQGINGSWSFDEKLLELIGFKISNLQILKKKVTDESVLASILFLTWLKKNGDSEALKIIFNKSLRWLKKSGIEGLDMLMKEAHENLNIA